MAAAIPLNALVALNRFGLGARPGDLAKAAADPRGFLKAELKQPDITLISLDNPAYGDLLGVTLVGWRHAERRPQVPFEGFELLAVIQPDQEIGDLAAL
jgi:uncharacterized protein (DUF1800 family)